MPRPSDRRINWNELDSLYDQQLTVPSYLPLEPNGRSLLESSTGTHVGEVDSEELAEFICAACEAVEAQLLRRRRAHAKAE